MARQSQPSIPVLLTRPQAEAETFAKALLDRFATRVRPLVAPLTATRYLAPKLPPGHFAAVVFTSPRAVEAARQLGTSLPQLAYCVGGKTAAAAAKAGHDTRSADGNVSDLISLILADKVTSPLLYLRGVDTTGDLRKSLLDHQVNVTSLQVYLQEPQPLTPAATQLLQAPAPLIVPLFSPRSARLFRQALPPDANAPLHIAALSTAVAHELDGLKLTALATATHPDAPGLLDAVESLLTVLSSP